MHIVQPSLHHSKFTGALFMFEGILGIDKLETYFPFVFTHGHLFVSFFDIFGEFSVERVVLQMFED